MYSLVVLESPYAPKARKPEGNCTCPIVCSMTMIAILDGDKCDFCKLWDPWAEELSRNVRYAQACI